MSRVAIIVPCYNVEQFLDECLRSVVQQTHRDLQVVVVDDGSQDGTGAIADRWSDDDERIMVVHQANAGLGAARNRGIEHAEGAWLCFLDSDDLLPLDAIERMVRSAVTSGSDIVSGVADRFNSKRRWRSGMYRRSFQHDVLGTHLFGRTDLLYDHIACSKLFRTDFWTKHDFKFPSGVLFEDIEVVTRAHCLARTVDLIAVPTYLWRERDPDSTSITQRRTRPGSTSARFAALRRLDEYLAHESPSHVWDAHGEKVFSLDAPTYSALAPRADDSFLREFVESARPVAVGASQRGIARISPLQRLLWNALAEGDARSVRAAGRVFEARRQRSPTDMLRSLRALPAAERSHITLDELTGAAQALCRKAVNRLTTTGTRACGDSHPPTDGSLP